jgi:hypothetical protein
MANANSTLSNEETTQHKLIPVLGARANINPVELNPNTGCTISDCIKAADKIAVHWWTILNEAHLRGDFPKSYQGDEAGNHSDIDEYSKWVSMAKRLAALDQGAKPDFRYEIWTSREHRLEGGFEYLIQAEQEKEKWLSRYPDAFVIRTNVKCPAYGIDDLSLLETLIGRVRWAGSYFGNREQKYDTVTLQDDTGRCVDIDAGMLITHPIWERLTPSTRERIQFDIDRVNGKEERSRLAASEAGGSHA